MRGWRADVDDLLKRDNQIREEVYGNKMKNLYTNALDKKNIAPGTKKHKEYLEDEFFPTYTKLLEDFNKEMKEKHIEANSEEYHSILKKYFDE